MSDEYQAAEEGGENVAELRVLAGQAREHNFDLRRPNHLVTLQDYVNILQRLKYALNVIDGLESRKGK